MCQFQVNIANSVHHEGLGIGCVHHEDLIIGCGGHCQHPGLDVHGCLINLLCACFRSVHHADSVHYEDPFAGRGGHCQHP